jgi:hypothetical protein
VAIDEAEFEALRREVQYLSDRQQILDCVNLYNRGLDRLDADLIRAAYHPDGIDHHGPFLGTVDEFVPFAIEVEATFAATHHGISTHHCEIDGDVAHAESYVHFFVQMKGKPVIGAGGGRYIDRLERRDGKWAIAVRRLAMDWTFEVPSSEWLGPDWAKFSGRRDRQDIVYQRPLQQPDKSM